MKTAILKKIYAQLPISKLPISQIFNSLLFFHWTIHLLFLPPSDLNAGMCT